MLCNLSPLLLITALLPLSSAQTITQTATPASSSSASPSISAQTTVSLFLPDTDPQPLVATVVSANPATTHYRIVCAPGTDSSDCGIPVPEDVTHISPSSYQGSLSTAGFAWSWACSLGASSAAAPAVCTLSAAGSAANAPGVTTVTVDRASAALLPVAVTAGAEKLGAGAATASGAGATSGSASASGSKSGSGSAAGAPTTVPNAAEGALGGRAWFAVLALGVTAWVFNLL